MLRLSDTSPYQRGGTRNVRPGSVYRSTASRGRSLSAHGGYVGEKWRGGVDGYVFATGWGDPIHPDTVGWLMTKTVRAYNAPKEGPRPAEPLPRARVHDLRHIHATTRSWLACPCMWWPLGWGTLTRPSRCGSTRTSSGRPK